MKQTININDNLLENASRCVGLEDVNANVDLALYELIANHKVINKRR